jgi:hypothetical protein
LRRNGGWPICGVEEEAQGYTNELFYRNGPEPNDIRRQEAPLVKETFERALREAYAAGQRDAI